MKCLSVPAVPRQMINIWERETTRIKVQLLKRSEIGNNATLLPAVVVGEGRSLERVPSLQRCSRRQTAVGNPGRLMK
ncbi:hypothetical protein PO124_33505 [Bacillus licheniformis]|nr:hypothetical protein [Bacillus licheniformis]